MSGNGQRQITVLLAHLLRSLALIDLAVMAGALVLCWLAGWLSLSQYGQSLVYIGAACVLIGFLSVVGQYIGVRGDAQYFIARSVSAGTLPERTQQMVADIMDSYRFLVLGALSGLSLIALGVLLDHPVW